MNRNILIIKCKANKKCVKDYLIRLFPALYQFKNFKEKLVYPENSYRSLI